MTHVVLLSVAELIFGLVVAAAVALFLVVVVSGVFRRDLHDHGGDYCPKCHDRFYNGLW